MDGDRTVPCVELRRTELEVDAHVIRNLWPLYQHDVSEFEGMTPNRHGILTHDPDERSLERYGARLDAWWSESDALFPYLIRADGETAGFALVAARARLPRTIDADFVMHEFFVVHAFRGRGVAERAALAAFAEHPGAWEVVTWPDHARAIAFWRRTIARAHGSEFSETAVDHAWGPRIAFRFEQH